MSPDQIVAAFKHLQTATLSEATPAPCDLPPEVRCMTPRARMVGPAFTIRCPLGDNTAVTRGVDAAPKGCVIVIDCGGPPRTAMWGETATFVSQMKGVAGCVTNGAVRDIDAIVDSGFPVFASAISLRGSVKGQPGQIGAVLTIGDIVIRPGDYVCGDSDGVVVIPADQAEAVLEIANRMHAEEQSRAARLKAGVPLAEILAKSGNRGQS